MCKFLLLEVGEEFALYVTPINIDPESPVMPISSPSVYALYLAKRHGTFATLGLAEDTWAVNEHVLGDQGFLGQGPADGEEDFIQVERLGDVVVGPEFHRLDGGGAAAQGGDDDDRNLLQLILVLA